MLMGERNVLSSGMNIVQRREQAVAGIAGSASAEAMGHGNRVDAAVDGVMDSEQDPRLH